MNFEAAKKLEDNSKFCLQVKSAIRIATLHKIRAIKIYDWALAFDIDLNKYEKILSKPFMNFKLVYDTSNCILVKTAQFVGSLKAEEVSKIPPDVDTIRIYTDGSATVHNNRAGGWGVYIVFPDGSEKIFKGREINTTVSRMEMKAVLKALEWSGGLPMTTKVNLYSDSAMVVNSINKGWLKRWHIDKYVNRPNADIWVKIYRQIESNLDSIINVRLHHINGHQKDLSNMHIFGNNMADLLANYKAKIKS